MFKINLITLEQCIVPINSNLEIRFADTYLEE